MQKLWLFSNKIAKLENLSALGDLREFWVQDNKITKLAGLENVSSLQILAVAANRLSDFKDLQKLAVLPNLRDLSLDDAHLEGSDPHPSRSISPSVAMEPVTKMQLMLRAACQGIPLSAAMASASAREGTRPPDAVLSLLALFTLLPI